MEEKRVERGRKSQLVRCRRRSRRRCDWESIGWSSLVNAIFAAAVVAVASRLAHDWLSGREEFIHTGYVTGLSPKIDMHAGARAAYRFCLGFRG